MFDPYADATTQLAAMAAGTLSAERLMGETLDRIARHNPALNAIVSQRDSDTLQAEAAALDARRAAGTPVGALGGLPMAVKDLALTAGLTTTFGSPLFADHVPAADELMVARLRAAGAIFVGKTNTPEFGLGSQTYNPVFGATGCAWNPALSAGGSSGGAAAALGAGLLTLADGSDMMGSLRNPAAWNHVFGLRPSPGRIPALPSADLFSPSLGTAGPMARSPRDLALLLSVQAGPDPRAPTSIDAAPASLVPAPGEIELAGLRIAWLGDWAGYYPLEAGVLDVCRSGLDRLSDAGADVTPITPDYDAARLWPAWQVLRQSAIAAKLAPLHADPAKHDRLKAEARWEIENGLAHSALDLHHAQVARSVWFAHLARWFETYDVIALPSAQVFAFERDCHWPRTIAGRPMDTYHRWMEIVVPGSLSGGPTLAMPAGFDGRGRAMGLQLLAPPRDERRLLAIAAACEAANPEFFALRPDDAAIIGKLDYVQSSDPGFW